MSDTQVTLEALLVRASRRLLLQRVIAGLCWGVSASLAVAVLLVITHRVLAPEWSLTTAGVWVIGAGPVIGAIVSLFWRREGEIGTALAIEGAVELHERFSSVLFLRGEKVHPEVLHALVDDGERHAEAVDLKAALPYRRPGATVPGLITLGVLVLTFVLLPTFDLLGAGEEREKRAEAKKRTERRIANVKKRARKELERIRNLAKREQVPPKTEKLLAQMQKRLENTPRKPQDRRKSLVDMKKMRDDLNKQRTRGDMQKMERMLSEMKRSQPMKSEEAKKIADAMKQGDMQKAAEGMQELAKKMQEALKDPTMDPSKAAELKDDLAKLMKNLEMPGLDAKLAEAMKGMDASALSDLMSEASANLDMLARLMKERDLLDQAMEEIQFTADELASMPQEWPQGGT